VERRGVTALHRGRPAATARRSAEPGGRPGGRPVDGQRTRGWTARGRPGIIVGRARQGAVRV